MLNITGSINTIKRSQGLKQSLFVSGGNIISALISAAALIVISRHLGPAEFGILSSCIALTLIVSKVFDFGINTATQRLNAKDPRQAFDRGGVVLLIKLAIAALLLLSSFFLAGPLARLLNISQVYLVRLSLIFAGLNLLAEFTISFINGLRHFYRASLANITQALAKLVPVLALIFFQKLNLTAAVVIYALSPATSLIIAWRLHRLRPVLSHSLGRHLPSILQAAKYIGFGVIAISAADNLDILIVKSFLSDHQTGLFAAASRITMLFNFIALSFTMVLSVRTAAFPDITHVRTYLKKALLFSITSFTLIALFYPLAPMFVDTILGRSYQLSIPIFRILLIATAINFTTVPFYALFYYFQNPRFYAYYGIILLATLIGFDLLLIPLMGITGAAISQVIMRSFLLLFTLFYLSINYRMAVAGTSR